MTLHLETTPLTDVWGSDGEDRTMMNERTEVLCAKLAGVQWFVNVGKPIPNEEGIVPVQTWEEAIQWCSHPVTGWVIVEARNQLYAQLASSHYPRFRQWNEIARSVLTIAEPIISTLIRPWIPLDPLPQALSNHLLSHLTGAMMECEYSDCVTTILHFQQMMQHYISGRFPCSWFCHNENDFPDRMTTMLF